MRLGQLTRIDLEDDVTILVALTWGDLKRMVRETDALPDGDDASGTAQLDFAENNLIEHVREVRGLEAEGGEAITKLDADNIALLPPSLVMEMWKRIMGVGDEGSDREVPPTG